MEAWSDEIKEKWLTKIARFDKLELAASNLSDKEFQARYELEDLKEHYAFSNTITLKTILSLKPEECHPKLYNIASEMIGKEKYSDGDNSNLFKLKWKLYKRIIREYKKGELEEVIFFLQNKRQTIPYPLTVLPSGIYIGTPGDLEKYKKARKERKEFENPEYPLQGPGKRIGEITYSGYGLPIHEWIKEAEAKGRFF